MAADRVVLGTHDTNIRRLASLPHATSLCSLHRAHDGSKRLSRFNDAGGSLRLQPSHVIRTVTNFSPVPRLGPRLSASPEYGVNCLPACGSGVKSSGAHGWPSTGNPGRRYASLNIGVQH